MEEDIIAKIREVGALRVETIQARMEADGERKEEVPREFFTKGKRDLVAIGASTGGPPALQNILSRLPRGLSAGIVISQHMPEGFTRLFADRLDRLVAFKVKEAENGDTVEYGKALIAPGGKHLLLRKRSNGKVMIALRKASESDHYTPSIDQMMISAAEIYRENAMGVLLTGMGDDGVLGMKAVKGGDGKTVAESEDTCIVFGMPREAQRAGVVDKMMPLGEIGPSIVRECSG
jgi:two-component system chemotaxis response regulator CheB